MLVCPATVGAVDIHVEAVLDGNQGVLLRGEGGIHTSVRIMYGMGYYKQACWLLGS